MSTARYLVGSAHERMAGLPDRSVDLVMTSPPFLALRSYLPAGHPAKGQELGSEATPGDYLDNLLAVTDEWRRLLAPHGSLCVELGDTYAGSGGAGGDYDDGGLRAGQERFTGPARQGRGDEWPDAKSLCGVPAAYQLSLAYGRNVLTGAESPAGRWRVRNLVAWVRTNPPVGALGDKFRPASSYLVVATRAKDRWFDLDAVRTPSDDQRANSPERATPPGQKPRRLYDTAHPAGVPPLDWWEIPAGGYRGAHYATYPPDLLTRPIEAMCPRRVCRICGQPSRRVSAASRAGEPGDRQRPKHQGSRRAHTGSDGRAPEEGRQAGHTTLGWTTCDCPGTGHLWDDGWLTVLAEAEAAQATARRRGTSKAERRRIHTTVLPPLYAALAGLYRGRADGFHDGPGWRPGHVLDPFAGTGTTGLVATGRGRTATLVDLDDRNADLARQRLGLLLDIDTTTGAAASRCPAPDMEDANR